MPNPNLSWTRMCTGHGLIPAISPHHPATGRISCIQPYTWTTCSYCDIRRVNTSPVSCSRHARLGHDVDTVPSPGVRSVRYDALGVLGVGCRVSGSDDAKTSSDCPGKFPCLLQLAFQTLITLSCSIFRHLMLTSADPNTIAQLFRCPTTHPIPVLVCSCRTMATCTPPSHPTVILGLGLIRHMPRFCKLKAFSTGQYLLSQLPDVERV